MDCLYTRLMSHIGANMSLHSYTYRKRDGKVVKVYYFQVSDCKMKHHIG